MVMQVSERSDLLLSWIMHIIPRIVLVLNLVYASLLYYSYEETFRISNHAWTEKAVSYYRILYFSASCRFCVLLLYVARFVGGSST